MKPDWVTYRDFPALGIHHPPYYIRKLMRAAKFPPAIVGGHRTDDDNTDHIGGRFWWDRDTIVAWVKEKKRANAKNK